MFKRSTGVAPELNLRTPLCTGNEAWKWPIPLWLWNPGPTSQEVQDSGIVAPWKRLMSPNFLKCLRIFHWEIIHTLVASIISTLLIVTWIKDKIQRNYFYLHLQYNWCRSGTRWETVIGAGFQKALNRKRKIFFTLRKDFCTISTWLRHIQDVFILSESTDSQGGCNCKDPDIKLTSQERY